MPSTSRMLAGAQTGLGKAIGALANGQKTYQDAYDGEVLTQSKIAQALAGIRLHDAQTEEATQKAAGLRRTNDLQSPEAIQQRAMLASGVPLTGGSEIDQYLTGGRIDKYQLGDGQAGPVMPAPAYAAPENLSALARRVAADQSVIGGSAKDQTDFFKGQEQQRTTGLRDDVLAGRLPAARLGAVQAALDGKPLVTAHEFGTVDNFTGAVDSTNPAAVRFGQYRNAQTGAQRANAAQSYAAAGASGASARLHNAQTEKVLAELKLMDGTPGAQASRQQASMALGVPMADIDPYAGMAPKMADQARKVAAANMDRLFAERGAQVDGELSMARDAQRFKTLNEKTPTGGINALPGAGALRGAFDGDFAEMRSISNRIVPKMREPGSGATSDFDAKMFQSATIGPDKPLATNRAIADAMIARAQQSADKLDFDRAYADLNGHLRGADRAWKQYVDANPIFDPASERQGRLALNQGRVPYQDYFRGRMGTGAQATGQPSPRPNSNGAPPQAGGRPPLDSFRR